MQKFGRTGRQERRNEGVAGRAMRAALVSQDGQGQSVVVTLAAADLASAIEYRMERAIERAVERLDLDLGNRLFEGAVPRFGKTCRIVAVAQAVGGFGRHSGIARRRFDAAANRQRVDKIALTVGRPAIATQGDRDRIESDPVVSGEERLGHRRLYARGGGV
jgi:hypothetical protein